jgi:hypothetical protein
MKRRNEEKPGIFTKRNAVGLLIVIIMVMSTLGYMIIEGDQNSNSDRYNGHKLISQNNYWYIEYAGKQIRLRFHPSTVDNIPLQSDARDLINKSKVLLLSINPEDKNIQYVELVRLELEREMPDLFKEYVLTGVVNSTPAYSAFNKISCQNATIDAPVVFFTTGSNESFEYSGYCLTVKAKSGNDLLIMKDRFILGLAGIIQ